MGVRTDLAPEEVGSIEYRRSYGFGISTNPPQSEEVREEPNPNEVARESIPYAKSEAWWFALDGTDGGFTQKIDHGDLEGAFVYRWQDAGCRGKARQEVLSRLPQFLPLDPRFEFMAVSIAEMREAFRSSSELVEIKEDWALCMRKAGFEDLVDTPDAYFYIQGLVDDPPETMTTEKIQDLEIAMAVADYECAVETRKYQRTKELDYRFQQEFVDEHKGEIEVLMAELRATSATSPS